MRQYTFGSPFGRDEIMLMYQGQVNRLVVRTEQGLTLELGLENPAFCVGERRSRLLSTENPGRSSLHFPGTHKLTKLEHQSG